MKKLLLLLFISLAVTVCGQAESNDLSKIFSPENVIIDVRTPAEYNRGHLKNAKNIPFDKIQKEIRSLVQDNEKTIVVYCRSGRRSSIAEGTLKKLGYKNVINAGSYTDLKKLEEKQKE